METKGPVQISQASVPSTAHRVGSTIAVVAVCLVSAVAVAAFAAMSVISCGATVWLSALLVAVVIGTVASSTAICLKFFVKKGPSDSLYVVPYVAPGPDAGRLLAQPITERRVEEKVYGKKALSIIYGNSVLFRLLRPFVGMPWVSRFYGWVQRRPGSRIRIARFIQEFKVDTDEFQRQPVPGQRVENLFSSFNDFFTRQLRIGARPFVQGERRVPWRGREVDDAVAMPVDGRYQVFASTQGTFTVKGKQFDLLTFLGGGSSSGGEI